LVLLQPGKKAMRHKQVYNIKVGLQGETDRLLKARQIINMEKTLAFVTWGSAD